MLSEDQVRHMHIISKIADFFYRTGVSFRIIDTAVFKNLVSALNPLYAQIMPGSKVLSGSLLDNHYIKCSQKIEGILSTSSKLTLVSDGCTNVNRQHLVNSYLTNERVTKLVFLYTNSVLLDESDNTDYISEEGALLTGSDCEEQQ